MSIESQILDTAENLFNHNGYTSVGVDLIRDESGVSKTTIYKHFSDKDGLIVATLKRRHQRFSNSLNERVNETSGVENKLLALLAWHYEWFSSTHFDGCMFMHALSEFKGRNKKICNVAIKHKIWVRSLIDSILSADMLLYHVSKVDLTMNIIEGLIINVEFFHEPPAIKTYEDIIIHIVNSKITN